MGNKTAINPFDPKIIIIALLICVAAFTNGLFMPEKISADILKLLESYFHKINFSFSGIFFNNLLASLVIFAGGLLLAVPSILSYYSNFLILGIALRSYSQKTGYLRFLISTMPHGVFELPALFIAFVLGLSIASRLLDRIFIKEKTDFKLFFAKILFYYISIVIPLLMIAAIVEVYVTPQLIRYFK